MSNFLFIAGHPVLDFLNTEKANGAGERVELLTESRSVTAWSEAAGLGHIAISGAVLAEARQLRDAVRTLVFTWTNDNVAPPEPLAILNAVLATGASYPLLTSNFAGGARPVADAPHPLLPVALSALDLFAHHDRTLVRKCGGSGCVLWFLDTTKNKRRRWCSMETCGNREKVSAHYKRVKKAAEVPGKAAQNDV